jgi:SAM-dependent methyltransferase
MRDAGNYNIGLPAIHLTINRFADPFDVISLQLVLEHVVNPVQFLTEQVKPRLKSGGRLLITVPNEFNHLQKLTKYYTGDGLSTDNNGFISKVHINYFTFDGLRNLLHHCGFKIVHESATFPIELFLAVGVNYRGNDSLGRKCHNFRLKTEKMMGARIFDWYKLLYRWFGIGRELIFVVEAEVE